MLGKHSTNSFFFVATFSLSTRTQLQEETIYLFLELKEQILYDS